MIHGISLRNFKCFRDISLDFGSLTLLSGLNGSGKSSVLQALLLLRQSHQKGFLESTGLLLNGDWTHIGTISDLFFVGAEEDTVQVGLRLANQELCSWSFSYDPSKKDSNVLDFSTTETKPVIPDINLFREPCHFLRADRLGPQTSFGMSDDQVRRHRQVGTKGEYTAHFLAVQQEQTLALTESKMFHPQQPSPNLRDQVEAWLGELCPGTRLHTESHPHLDLVGLRYSFASEKGGETRFRATNVGFGISYALSVVVAILSSSRGTLLMLENPEAHLHPRGQTQMGKLIALAAASGIQIVVETHSDHVLNGIRLAVVDQKISHEDVKIHFFERVQQKSQWETHVLSPKLTERGRIDQWPTGFFDEWDNSLMRLLEV